MENLQQLCGVLIVLGLLCATLWWLRRRGLAHFSGLPRRRKGGMLQSVECLPLSVGNTLHLVRIANRGFLITSSPSGCRVVDRGPWSSFESNLPEVRS